MRRSHPSQRKASTWAGVVLGLCCWPGPAAAMAQTPAEAPATAARDESRASDDLSAVRLVGPVGAAPAGSLRAAAGAGYGFTESVLGRDDRHHRLLGTVATEWTFVPSLALGLRLDGRYDRHHLGAAAGDPARDDDGWTGLPQLDLRWSHSLDPATQAGLALHVVLPGGQAPSITPGAISPELIGSGAHQMGRLALVGALGYRIDRAAHAVPAPEQLSAADRVSLGVNAFDAILVGLGLYQHGDDLTLFAEALLEALTGAGRPPASQWPLRIGLGARHALTSTITGEVAAQISPSARPSLAGPAPLVDLPPRIALLLGLLWAGPRAPRGAATPATGAAPTAATPAPMAAAAAPLPLGQLRCAVRSFGGVGISASLRIISGPDVAAPAPALHSRDGTFSIELAPGSYEVVIEAVHFVPQRRTIAVEKNGVTLLNADLRRAK
jgi:hypothetical protein